MAANYCSHCGTALRQGDRFCAQCGAQAGETRDTALVMHTLGPNQLLFEQTADSSRLEASFTDATAQQLAEVVQTLVGGRIIRPASVRSIVADVPAIAGQDSAVPLSRIESPHAIPEDVQGTSNVQRDTSVHSGPVETPPDVGIARIFTMRGGEVRLNTPILKARNPTDYANRLTRMYLYYMHQQHDMTEVPKADTYAFLKSTSIRSSDFQPAISKDQSIDKTKTALKLNFAGEQQVKRYLEEMDNPEIEDGWYPGKDERTSTTRKRHSRKQSVESSDTGKVSPETWTEEVRQLQALVATRHEEIAQWPSGQLALLGLYLERKQHGPDTDVSYRKVRQLLYQAFELETTDDKLRKALDRVKQAKLVISGADGSGYRINPSGMRQIKESLKLGEPEETQLSEANGLQPDLFASADIPSANGTSES